MGQTYELVLETLLENNLIMLPQTTSSGISFLRNYCVYHQHNENYTFDRMELKHKIQDLINYEVIEIEILMNRVVNILLLSKIKLVNLFLIVVLL